VPVTTWEYADLWLAIARPTAADSRTTFAILDVDAAPPKITQIAKPLTYFNELGREGWIVPPRGRVDINVLQTKITEVLGPAWVAIGGNHFRLRRERPERAVS
jgi:hypothetical protein